MIPCQGERTDRKDNQEEREMAQVKQRTQGKGKMAQPQSTLQRRRCVAGSQNVAGFGAWPWESLGIKSREYFLPFLCTDLFMTNT